MVRVSKKELPKDVEWELFKQFSAMIVAQQRPKDSDAFLYELLTRSERTVLVKRVGIIALLQRGYNAHTVSTALNVSPTTVGKIEEGIERGEYKNIAATLKRKEHRESILGILESLVSSGYNPQHRAREKIQQDIEAWKAGSR